MRPELQAVIDRILDECREGETLSIDRLGEILGTMAISADEVDRLLWHLEARGRHVSSPSGGSGETVLGTVLPVARVLAAELGRAPTVAEIAARTSLDPTSIRHALALAKVIARG